MGKMEKREDVEDRSSPHKKQCRVQSVPAANFGCSKVSAGEVYRNDFGRKFEIADGVENEKF